MFRSSLLLLMMSGCAAVPVAGSRDSQRPPVEVVGHVKDTCPAGNAQPNEAVTLRAAGELDALDTTRTDASGAFRFLVVPPDAPAQLFIEARGRKALVKPQEHAKDVQVAELSLPCER